MLIHALALQLLLAQPARAVDAEALLPIEPGSPPAALAQAEDAPLPPATLDEARSPAEAAPEQVDAAGTEAASADVAPPSAAPAPPPSAQTAQTAPPPAAAPAAGQPPAESTPAPVAMPDAALTRPHPGTGRAFAAALAGTVGADVFFGGLVAIGVVGAFSGDFLDGNDDASAAWATLALVGASGFVFVTPGVTVWAAQRAVGRERFLAAYSAVFALRLLGFAAAAAFPPIAIVTELLVVPYVAARIVASGTPLAQRAPLVPPAPASAAGGPAFSRAICPDAALAMR